MSPGRRLRIQKQRLLPFSPRVPKFYCDSTFSVGVTKKGKSLLLEVETHKWSAVVELPALGEELTIRFVLISSEGMELKHVLNRYVDSAHAYLEDTYCMTLVDTDTSLHSTLPLYLIS